MNIHFNLMGASRKAFVAAIGEILLQLLAKS